MLKENSKRPYKLAYFVTHPIPYQAPLLRKIANKDSIDFKTFFISDHTVRPYFDTDFNQITKWDTPLLEGYDHVFLKKIFKSNRLAFFIPFVYGISKALREENWDAVWVHGYNHFSLIIVLFLAWFYKIPIFFRAESTLLATKPNFFKDIFIRHLVRSSSALLYVSSLNKEYYLDYGAREKQLFFTPYAVDNDFYKYTNEEKKKISARLIKENDIDEEATIILFVGKLIDRKNPLILLEAFHQLINKQPRNKMVLMFAGTGPDLELIENKIKDYNLDSTVKILGFKNERELRDYYAIANLLVLPSKEETFGLVINEAMSASTAIIASDKIGSSKDLVINGINGFIFKSENLESLTTILEKTLSNKETLLDMAEKSEEIIKDWNYEKDLEGIISALDSNDKK
tara:strand:+ start:6762 stop:7964 length:1203 start_codon:yes stop_codon:yes gene_type:complete